MGAFGFFLINEESMARESLCSLNMNRSKLELFYFLQVYHLEDIGKNVCNFYLEQVLFQHSVCVFYDRTAHQIDSNIKLAQ